ncbi:MAG: hypothetical protein LBE98_00060 [Puniceicoccales bacterium]|jgi:hypothetical protein|nr:hypothetical protein [Puniceicoccales bacterium]
MDIVKLVNFYTHRSQSGNNTSDDNRVSSPVPQEIALPSGVTFDEYCGGTLHLCEDLKPKVLEAFRKEGGMACLDRIIRCARSTGKRCFIVSSDYQWKEGDPGSADDIFLRLLKDRMVDATSILQNLEEEIGKFLPREGQAIPGCTVEFDSVMDVHVRVPLDLPEYSIEVENGEYDESFIVRVVQRSTDMCNVLVDTVVSPFMVQSGAGEAMMETSTTMLAEVKELIQSEEYSTSDGEEFSNMPSATSKDLSRGYCITIPDVGDVLISHGGDVVFNGAKITHPVHVSCPSSVVLKDTDAGRMTITSSSVVLINQRKTTIDSLSFQSNDGNVAGIYVDAGTDLRVGELSLNHALLVNTGKLIINGANTLDDVALLNAGELETAHPLANISHLWNCARGVVKSCNDLMVSAATVSNMGTIIAPQINLICESLLSNFGTIESSHEVNIYGDGDVQNRGIITGEEGGVYVTGERFRQYGDGELHGDHITFRSQTTELSGRLAGHRVTFAGTTAVMNDVYADHMETMELETAGHFLACQGSNFGSIRELINRGCATFKCDLNDVGHVHNTSSGELLLLNHTNVTGPRGILNDGHIVVHGGKGSQEDNSVTTGMKSQNSTLNIGEEYVGSEGATLEYTNGATVVAGKYTNHGTSFSHNQLTVEEHGDGNIYGHVAAQNAIEYHVHGGCADFGGHVIIPEILGERKHFLIRSDDGISITSSFNGAVQLEMVTPGEITNRSEVTALSIGIRSCSQRDGEEAASGLVVNYGTLSASDGIEVVAKNIPERRREGTSPQRY